MAGGRKVDLGTVGFDLTANTEDLLRSLQVLQSFGKEVDKVAKLTAKATEETDKAAGSSKALASSLRDLERAAILAVGPLSGVGARLAVMSAMFNTMSASVATTIVAITGVGAALGVFVTSVIKATMEMQRFEAVLTASTGNAILVGAEYQRVAAFAQKWGIAVQDLVEPYAKFTVAARLSGLSLSDQARAFEAVTISSRALNLSGERTQLVFLALEQMLSKGTVNLEELRRQLGDLLPGAFQIAANAMGMTQAEFQRAITSGQILATDLIPKLSEQLIMLFGPSAERASHNLNAELARLKTSVFDVQKAFEDQTHITSLFTSAIVSTTQLLNFLSANMRDVIGTIGALAGAGGMLLLVTNLGRIRLAIMAVIESMVALRTAIFALELAATATIVGKVVQVFGALAAVTLGAVAGFEAFRPAQQKVTEGFEEQLKMANEWLDMQTRLKASDEQTTSRTISSAADRISVIDDEIQKQRASLQALQGIAAARQREQQIAMGADTAATARRRSGGISSQEESQANSLKSSIAELEEQRKRWLDLMTRLGDLQTESPTNSPLPSHAWEQWAKSVQKSIRDTEMMGQELAAATEGDGAMRKLKAMREALDMVARQPDQQKGDLGGLIDTLTNLGYVFRASGADAEAFEKTLKDGQITAATNEVILGNLLSQMMERHDLFQKQIQDVARGRKEMETAMQTLSNMDRALQDRRDSLSGGSAVDDRINRQVADATRKYSDLIDTLTKLRLTKEQVEELDKRGDAGSQAILDNNKRLADTLEVLKDKTQGYSQELRSVLEAEDKQKNIDSLRKSLEALDNQLGARSTRALEQYQDRLIMLNKAVAEGIMTQEEATKRIVMATGDVMREEYSRSEIFGRQIISMFHTIETNMSKALVDPLFGVKKSWQQFFTDLLRMIVEFAAKQAIVTPSLKFLFGDYYTQKFGTPESSGEGLIGGSLFGANGILGSTFGGLGGMAKGIGDTFKRNGPFDTMQDFGTDKELAPQMQKVAESMNGITDAADPLKEALDAMDAATQETASALDATASAGASAALDAVAASSVGTSVGLDGAAVSAAAAALACDALAAAATAAAAAQSTAAVLSFAADGGVMTGHGMMPLRQYASGGVANSPQMAIFGEGSMPEAYVPLPDGRSIPVKMKGGGAAGDLHLHFHGPVWDHEEFASYLTDTLAKQDRRFALRSKGRGVK